MPKTFWTFIICLGRAGRYVPAVGLLVERRDPRRHRRFGLSGGTGGNGTYYAMLVMGLLTAMLTAAYMTRCIYLTFFGEYRGHGTPHESGPRITTPLIILVGLRDLRRFRQPAGKPLRIHPRRLGACASSTTSNRWATTSRPSTTPTRATLLALLSIVAVIVAVAMAATTTTSCSSTERVEAVRQQPHRAARRATTKFALARAGYTFLVNKYYLDHLYNNVIVYAVKKPIANAAYWFNQKVLDGIVDGVGQGFGRRRPSVYKYFDQGLVDGIVNGSGIASDEAGQGSAQDADRQSPAVRGDHVRRSGHPRRHSRDRRAVTELRTMEFLEGWGISIAVFAPVDRRRRS